ncbi:MAG TPA: hypothetical protein VIQ27_15760 [Gemmatimonadales bacterium]
MRLSQASFVAAVLAVAALGCAAELATFPRSDMAFLVYAAERVVDGARLYVDVVEINPPLIVAWNIPAVVLGRTLGVSDVLLLRLWDALALLGALAFSAWALGLALGSDQTGRRLLVVLLAFALFLGPGNDYGQREHLLIAFALPYVFLAAGRIDGRKADPGPAFAAGVLAGTGLALKPHFFFLWAATEGFAVWRTRRTRPSPEAMGTIGFLTVYAGAAALFTPDFFRMALLLGPAYTGFGHYSFVTVLVTARGVTESALALLACFALYRHSRHPTLWLVIAIALLASFMAGAAQLKGWSYHFLPARVFASLLLALAVVDVRRAPANMVQRLYASIAFAAVGAGLFWATSMGFVRILHRDPARQYEQAQLNQLVAAVRRHVPAGGSLYVFSYTIGSSFPLVNESGVRWASRFPHLWIIEAAYHDQLNRAPPLRWHTAAEMKPAERYLNDAVAKDLARYRPDVVMVLRHARDLPENSLRRIDYLGYFRRDPRIAEQLGLYRWAEGVGQYDLYVRVASEAAPGRSAVSSPGEHDVLRSSTTGGAALLADRTLLLRFLFFLLLVGSGLAGVPRWTQRELDSTGQEPG